MPKQKEVYEVVTETAMKVACLGVGYGILSILLLTLPNLRSYVVYDPSTIILLPTAFLTSIYLVVWVLTSYAIGMAVLRGVTFLMPDFDGEGFNWFRWIKKIKKMMNRGAG